MSVKSVIEIDVKDEKFKAFTAEFTKFKSAISGLEKIWKNIGVEIDNAGQDAVKSSKEAEKANKAAVKAEKDATEAAKNRLKVFRDISKTTKDIAFNLAGGAVSLAKWATLGAITSGFGIGALAGSAAGNRREAQGIGISTAQLQAAKVTYGTKFIDAQSVLSNIANVQSDLSQRGYLDALVGRSLGGKTPGEILPALLTKLTQKFIQGGGTLQAFQAQGLNRFVSLEEARRLAAGYKSGELQQANVLYGRNTAKYAVQDNINQAWADFIVKLKDAGVTVENSLIKSLVKVEPVLAKFADTLSTSISEFFGSKDFENTLKSFVENMKKFVSFIGSDKFKADIEALSHALLSLANGINWVVSKIPGATVEENKPPQDLLAGVKATWAAVKNPFAGSIESKSNKYVEYLKSLGQSELAATALVGGAIQESSLQPHRRSGTHEGLFQWSTDRQQNYNKWALTRGLPSFSQSSDFNQLAFANYELTQGGERKAGLALKNARTLLEASQAAFSFERPYDNTLPKRYSYAQDIYNKRNPYAAMVPAPYLISQPTVRTTIMDNTGGNVIASTNALSGALFNG